MTVDDWGRIERPLQPGVFPVGRAVRGILLHAPKVHFCPSRYRNLTIRTRFCRKKVLMGADGLHWVRIKMTEQEITSARNRQEALDLVRPQVLPSQVPPCGSKNSNRTPSPAPALLTTMPTILPVWLHSLNNNASMQGLQCSKWNQRGEMNRQLRTCRARGPSTTAGVMQNG